ncbi:MAG TPA: hypothetical protein VKY26_04985, partial [Actinomycetota bacterium]|nr:hypothetical protein [Actinomycetota bacterium]
MSGFGLVYRSALRTRWRSWLVLAGLVAITGGACLAALAAGQRTGSAVPRLLASTGSPDAQMISGPIAGSPTSVPYPTVAALPGVLSDARGSAFYYAQLLVAGGEQSQTNGGAGVVSFPTGPGSLHPKLLAGRFPDPSKPDEVLADYALENSFPHVRVGARVVVTLLAADQPAGVLTNEVPPVLGATVTMTVVGLDVDGPSLPAGSQDAGTVQVTPAFVHEYGAGSFSGAVDILRLRGGAAGLPRFEAALQAVPGVAPGLANVGVVGADAGYAVVEASIHPQVVGWWILAALTGCAAAAVIVQALSRQAALEADSYPALRSIGFSPRG